MKHTDTEALWANNRDKIKTSSATLSDGLSRNCRQTEDLWPTMLQN